MEPDDAKIVNRFCSSLADRIRVSSPQRGPGRNRSENTADSLRRIAFAALAGIGDYSLLPSIHLGKLPAHIVAESAIFMSISAYLLSGIDRIKTLCANDPEQKLNDRKNVSLGAVGGLSLGATVAAVALAAIPPLHPILLAGGLLLVFTGAGMGGSQVWNKSAKIKYCPHCFHKGRCDQKVCRDCYNLFFPLDIQHNCDDNPVLSFIEVASYLRKWKLSYFDAKKLVEEHWKEWEWLANAENENQIDCGSFFDWIDKSKSVVTRYGGWTKDELASGRCKKSTLDDELDKNEL